MARTEIRGGEQIKNLSVLREDLIANFLGGSNWDISAGAANATITGLAQGVANSDAVNMEQLNALEAKIGSPMRYKGILDVATPTPDLDAIDNLVGDMYLISVGGTYLGETWNAGDNLIVNKDVAAGVSITSADVDKIDNTESLDLIRTSDVVDNLTSTGVVDKPLSANQGFVLDARLDTLEAVNYTHVPLASYAITNNSPVVAALANTPAAGREAVYLNGLRMLSGSGNDYTISGAVITFEYNLHTNDQVTVEYEY